MENQHQDKHKANEQAQHKSSETIANEETIKIKSQKNVLSGLSETERAQAAEEENKNLGVYGSEANSSTRTTVNGGLSEKERIASAEADGKIDGAHSGLSDTERRDAAEESW